MNEGEFVAKTISIYDKASPPFLSLLNVCIYVARWSSVDVYDAWWGTDFIELNEQPLGTKKLDANREQETIIMNDRNLKIDSKFEYKPVINIQISYLIFSPDILWSFRNS